MKKISDVVSEHYDESTASMECYTVELPSNLPPRFRAYVTITRRDGKPLAGKDLELVKENFPVEKKHNRRTKRSAKRSRVGSAKRKAAKRKGKHTS